MRRRALLLRLMGDEGDRLERGGITVRERQHMADQDLEAILAAAEPKLPHLRFHDLRHSAASLLIAAGVELVEVSMLLGHSELRVTADLYSHLQKQTAAKAARHMDAVLNR